MCLINILWMVDQPHKVKSVGEVIFCRRDIVRCFPYSLIVDGTSTLPVRVFSFRSGMRIVVRVSFRRLGLGVGRSCLVVLQLRLGGQ